MIKIEQIHKSYGDKVLMDSVSYHFPTGEKIALVGDNGAGKSTLLNILTQNEHPDSGTITKAEKATTGFLPQMPNPCPEATILEECIAGNSEIKTLKEQIKNALTSLEEDPKNEKYLEQFEAAEFKYKSHGGYSIESEASSILSGLGFEQNILQKSPLSLSGGWRMRLELAKIFIKSPDFLILDEPTNHLDLPSLVWVENYLKSFRGTLLFVSHDRILLNKLSTIILHLNAGSLKSYKGNYDEFISARELHLAQEQATAAQLQKKREHLDQFVKKFGAKATKAKQAQSRVKMIEKIKTQEMQLPKTQANNKSIQFSLPIPMKSDRILYQIKDGSIGYQTALSKGINLEIQRGQKIAIIGANGIGKSTLLKTIFERIKPLEGEFFKNNKTKISYFAQDQLESLDGESSIIDNLKKFSQLNDVETRSLLGAFLFHGDDIFKQVKVLSGGEKSRVGLASILSQESNLLVLDEPTNHLDMKSASSLMNALKNFSGTILFVSHDRNLINQVCTHVFAMLPDGRSQCFEGNLSDYQHLAKISHFPNVLEIADDSTKKNVDNSEIKTENKINHNKFKELKKSKNLIENKIKKNEKTIESCKQKLSKVEKKMATISPEDFHEMNQLHQEQLTMQKSLEDHETEWLSLCEELETIEEHLNKLGRH